MVHRSTKKGEFVKSLFFLSCLAFASVLFISCESFKSNRSKKTADEDELELKRPKISLGDEHTCARLSNDKIKCWGYNNSGQLGLEDTDNRGDEADEMGTDLPFVDLGDFTVKQIVLGGSHTCALLSNDKIKCWGRNSTGQLGLGDTDNRGDEADQMGDDLPFVDLGDFTVKQISLGAAHTCALLSNDKIKCWGRNSSGQLGLGNTDKQGDAADEMGDNLLFVDLGTYDHDNDTNTAAIALKAKQIVLGANHTCALLSNDKIKCWGLNSSGQLGLEHNKTYQGGAADEMGDNLPVVDLGTYDHDGDTNTTAIALTAKQISLGGSHTCARLSNNKIKCWGANGFGQLGLENTNNQGDAASEMGDDLPFVDLGTDDAKYIALRSNQACALLSNDKIKCWGYNSVGQLGLGNTNDRGDAADEMGTDLPSVDLGTYNVKLVALGNNHTCALLSNDKIKCWGFNDSGQLGLEDTDNRGDASDEMGTDLPFVNLGN